MVLSALENAINSDELKTELTKLNKYFFNRKHEGQIRDAILVHINEKSESYRALSEYPKLGQAAVDLTIFSRETNDLEAVVEFKHHYPLDLRCKNDLDDVLKDIRREVLGQSTTHFVLILQARELSGKYEFTNTPLIPIDEKTKGDFPQRDYSKRDYLVDEEAPKIIIGPIKYLREKNRNDVISTNDELEVILEPLNMRLSDEVGQPGKAWDVQDPIRVDVNLGPVESQYVFIIYGIHYL